MSFEWTPEIAIGNRFIDEQHKQLFAAADALFTACQLGKETQEVEKTMNFLLEYTAKHFADEEALQRRFCYPDCASHKRLHEEFTARARNLSQKLAQTGSTDEFVIDVYTSIGEWLINHIKGEDVKLVEYIQQ